MVFIPPQHGKSELVARHFPAFTLGRNPEMRLFTCSHNAWVVLTHTRWHRDDLAGQLKRKMAVRRADQWEVLSLPAVRGEGPGDPIDPRGPGEVLWPEFKSAADLEVIRRQDARAYAAL
jgi:hypothetical protein